MPIVEPAIRPPSEAASFLLQITTGCSANRCTFCGAYKSKTFKIKNMAEIEADIRQGALYYPNTRKVFLMDGDALIINNKELIPILKKLNESFPKLTRISTYANARNIILRNQKELEDLKKYKLKLIYMGLESGAQQILNSCKKKATVEDMLLTVEKAKKAHIKSSIIVLLGLGGKEFSNIHVKETIEALNEMQPEYLSFLTLMLIPNTELYKDALEGQFQELDAKDFLKESYDILAGLDLSKTIFRCNHASNYISLEGRLPQNKEQLLQEIEYYLKNETSFKPELFRGL